MNKGNFRGASVSENLYEIYIGRGYIKNQFIKYLMLPSTLVRVSGIVILTCSK